MPDFTVKFDPAPFEALDQLALLARQDYNLGGAGDWFGEFRGGLYGFYSRMHGVQRHYLEVHEWLPSWRSTCETEYHLTSILFQMDSALECLTFALNAIGWAVAPAEFRDVTDFKAQKKIAPVDIVGDAGGTPVRAPLPGYLRVFPTVQAAWQKEIQSINQIRDLHDASKHRRTVFVGGRYRSDPPEGFLEKLGIRKDWDHRILVTPMAEIILKRDPKLPRSQRKPYLTQGPLLEDLVPKFAALIKNTSEAALKDAQLNVPLKETQFRRAEGDA